MNKETALLGFFDKNQIRYKLNVEMKDYTSFKIGGPAKVMVFPSLEEHIQKAMAYCNQNNIHYFILGKGSNLLVSDKGYDGVIICTCCEGLQNIEKIDEETIRCQAGVNLSVLCKYALDHGLSGLEFAYGIPGSVGGAAYMNAGAYGGEMKNVVFRCYHISKSGENGYFESSDLEFSYRHSVYSNLNYCITHVYIKLKKADKHAIQEKMKDLIGRRKEKQPLEYPSGGSTFKRPDGAYASALIEECGLKGMSFGDAQVSEKHSGFVINIGNATCKDVLDLVEYIKEKVAKKTGYQLECEIKQIGEK